MHSQKTLSPIFSNLAKAAEKQHLNQDAELFGLLAEKFHEPGTRQTVQGEDSLNQLRDGIAADLTEEYPALQSAGEKAADRGVLRALKWGQKVTTIQKTLIDRFLAKGDELMEGKELFICEACGFIFLGTGTPDICPVCKAPHRRFSMIK